MHLFKIAHAAVAVFVTTGSALAGFVNTTVTAQFNYNPPFPNYAAQSATVGAGLEFADLGSHFSLDIDGHR